MDLELGGEGYIRGLSETVEGLSEMVGNSACVSMGYVVYLMYNRGNVMARDRQVAIFRIEGLSNGMDMRMVDEFDGLLIPQPNAKPGRPSNDYARARSQAIAAKRAEILALLFAPKPIHKPFKRRM